jgi:3-phenylpropionate/cinnamic acid dioxygenase small subunit
VGTGERAAIIDIYNAYAEGVDSKNWEMVRQCFADQIRVDYGATSAATGAPDQPRNADDWVGVLQSVINGFDFTRHTITNHRFSREGEWIVCRAYLTADHVILADPANPAAAPDEIATVVGEYTNTCELGANGWKIRESKLEMQWSRGNGALFAEAMARAAKL